MLSLSNSRISAGAEAHVSALKPYCIPKPTLYTGVRAAGDPPGDDPASHSTWKSTEASRDYAEWVRLYDTIDDDDRRAIATAIEKMNHLPLISVVMPVYNTPGAISSSCHRLSAPTAVPELGTVHRR